MTTSADDGVSFLQHPGGIALKCASGRGVR
jgi:hypothetical protein